MHVNAARTIALKHRAGRHVRIVHRVRTAKVCHGIISSLPSFGQVLPIRLEADSVHARRHNMSVLITPVTGSRVVIGNGPFTIRQRTMSRDQ